MEFEPTIGLEIHTQLNTQTKLFCACPTMFGVTPNQNTCPVCLGLPGALPVLNGLVVHLAIRIGLAVHCDIRLQSEFARKNYFYPDLPKAYQISQFDQPLCENGWVEFEVPQNEKTGKKVYTKRVNIVRIHIEEDAGKLVHESGVNQGSYIDLNRAGTPLVEIVSAPDLETPQEAKCYMETMHRLVTHTEVSRGNLERGNFRADANVSLHPKGDSTLGTRTETKNLNSFRFLEQAIYYEMGRQEEVLLRGDKVIQETRLFDTVTGVTHPMRVKEDADDYRYFPDPDLYPLHISGDLVEKIRQRMPELPAAKKGRYCHDLGLSEYDATVLVSQLGMAKLFDAVVNAGAPPKRAANWVSVEVAAKLNEDKIAISDLKFDAKQLAHLIGMIEDEEISSTAAKVVFDEMHISGRLPRDIVQEKHLSQVSNEDELLAIIEKMLADNPKQVAEYQGGKDRMFGFFVGQVMKLSAGKANPKTVTHLLKKTLRQGS